MSNLQAIADRFEIETLRGEVTDAVMMRDFDRGASLLRSAVSHINAEFVGREEIRAAVERLQGLWEYFAETTHPGTIRLEDPGADAELRRAGSAGRRSTAG